MLAIYTSYMAMPEGASSYVFLDPRGLMVTNGIVTFACTYTVEKEFAYCIQDVELASTVFAVYCLFACWLDAGVELVFSYARIFKIAKYAAMQGTAIAPLIGLLSTHTSHMPSVVLVGFHRFPTILSIHLTIYLLQGVNIVLI